MFARTSSRAAFDQRNSRFRWLLLSSSIFVAKVPDARRRKIPLRTASDRDVHPGTGRSCAFLFRADSSLHLQGAKKERTSIDLGTKLWDVLKVQNLEAKVSRCFVTESLLIR